MAKSIAIHINEPDLPRYSVDDLEPLQGELKTLSDENRMKLKNLLVKNGFKLSLHIWQNGGVNYLIDGHQRVAVLQGLKRDGWDVPPIPCVRIEAKNYREAKNTVLLAVSQHGKINKDGFDQFVEGEGFEFGDLDFPDVGDDFFPDLDAEKKAEEREEIEDQVPEIPEDENPYGVERGDIWLLGAYLECDKCNAKVEYDKSRVDTPCDCEVASA